jgi:hypothetical protein
MTNIEYKIGTAAVFWFMMTCSCIFGWGFLCCDNCKDIDHKCKKCGNIVGDYKKRIC